MSIDSDAGAELVAEKLRHTISLLRTEVNAVKSELASYREFANFRINELEAQKKDHEQRIRSLQESSTQFKVMAGLATGGGILGLINLIKGIF